MEINNTRTNHEHATTSLKVILLIFAIVLIGALAYMVWVQNMSPDIADGSTTTAKTATSPIAGWKTYTNTDPSYSFSYPDDVVFAKNDRGLVLALDLVVDSYTTDVSSFKSYNYGGYITNDPVGDNTSYSKVDLENERAAISKNDPVAASETSHGWLRSSYKMVSSNNLSGVSFVQLTSGFVCQMQFSLRAHYYIGQNKNDLVEILVKDNSVGQIMEANSKYFDTTDV